MDRNDPALSSEEQMRYARVLQVLSRSGLFVLIVGFFIYVGGLVPAIVPVKRIPGLLHLRANDFVKETGMPTGWDWVHQLDKGEVISGLGVIYLSLATIVCFLAILPLVLRKKDIPYITIVVLELLVLILSASGIITMGAH